MEFSESSDSNSFFKNKMNRNGNHEEGDTENGQDY